MPPSRLLNVITDRFWGISHSLSRNTNGPNAEPALRGSSKFGNGQTELEFFAFVSLK